MAANENKEIVKRLLEGFNAREWDDVTELFAPDYVNHNPPDGVSPDRAGQLNAMQGLLASFPDMLAEATHVIAEGDFVVVRDVVRGTHEGEFGGKEGTGMKVEATFIHVYRISGGRIAERWGLADVLTLLQQVGAL